MRRTSWMSSSVPAAAEAYRTTDNREQSKKIPPRLGLLEDERLARLVSRGSERAFATLYERYHRQLYAYCYLLLHDDEDAYDALQAAVTRALAALREGQREGFLRPWLFRLAREEA